MSFMMAERANAVKLRQEAVESVLSGVTWVGPDLTVTGTLEGDGRIEIHGTVDGDVKGHDVTVAETGRVEGSIVADNLQIRGAIEGSVRATTVAITKTARVIGDITHLNLLVENGAYLEGRRPWRPRPLGQANDQFTFSEKD